MSRSSSLKSWLRHIVQAPIFLQNWHRMTVPPLTHPEHHCKIVYKYQKKKTIFNSYCSFWKGLPFSNLYLMDSSHFLFRLGFWRFWQDRFPSRFGDGSGWCSSTSRTHASVTDSVFGSEWFSLSILRSSARGHCELHFTIITLPFLILSCEIQLPKEGNVMWPDVHVDRATAMHILNHHHVPSQQCAVRTVAQPISGEQHESIWSSCCAGAPTWRAPAANRWRRVAAFPDEVSRNTWWFLDWDIRKHVGATHPCLLGSNLPQIPGFSKKNYYYERSDGFNRCRRLPSGISILGGVATRISFHCHASWPFLSFSVVCASRYLFGRIWLISPIFLFFIFSSASISRLRFFSAS